MGGGGEKRNRKMNTGKTSVEELFSLSKTRIIHFWYQGPFSYNCNLYRARILYWVSVVSRVKIIGIVFFSKFNTFSWWIVEWRTLISGESASRWKLNEEQKKKNDAGKGIYFFLTRNLFWPSIETLMISVSKPYYVRTFYLTNNSFEL